MNAAAVLPHKLRLVLASIRFEHSLFALPFAYIGMFLAADGLPTWEQFLWITVAMVGARTVAMTANRMVHAKEDAANPRTSGRHLPQGLLKRRDMALMMLVSMGVFVFAASQLNTLALVLSPVVLAVLFLYTYRQVFHLGKSLDSGLGRRHRARRGVGGGDGYAGAAGGAAGRRRWRSGWVGST